MNPINFNLILNELYHDLMIESYGELEKNGFAWAKDIPFTQDEKSNFLNEMIKFYEDREEFEKCENLYNMKNA